MYFSTKERRERETLGGRGGRDRFRLGSQVVYKVRGANTDFEIRVLEGGLDSRKTAICADGREHLRADLNKNFAAEWQISVGECRREMRESGDPHPAERVHCEFCGHWLRCVLHYGRQVCGCGRAIGAKQAEAAQRKYPGVGPAQGGRQITVHRAPQRRGLVAHPFIEIWNGICADRLHGFLGEGVFVRVASVGVANPVRKRVTIIRWFLFSDKKHANDNEDPQGHKGDQELRPGAHEGSMS